MPSSQSGSGTGSMLYAVLIVFFLIVSTLRNKKNKKKTEQKKQTARPQQAAPNPKPHPVHEPSFESAKPRVKSTQTARIKPRVYTTTQDPNHSDTKTPYWEPFNPPAPTMGVEGSDSCHEYMLDDHASAPTPDAETAPLSPETQNIVRGIIWSQILERKEF